MFRWKLQKPRHEDQRIDVYRVYAALWESLAADEFTPQGEEGLMNIGPPLVADGQPAEAIEPSERTLHHPAVAAEACARVDPLVRDADADVALAQGAAAA